MGLVPQMSVKVKQPLTTFGHLTSRRRAKREDTDLGAVNRA
jgi:hypothetical protein